jgi:hypothetical protein
MLYLTYRADVHGTLFIGNDHISFSTSIIS